MRIVFLSPRGQPGGAENSLLDFLASLRAAEPDWSLHLVVGEDGPLVSKARELGVAAIVLPFPPALVRLGDAGAGGPAGNNLGLPALLSRLVWASPAVARYVRQFRRVLRELRPELLHSSGFKMHVLSAWARPPRVPLVWHIHDYVRPRPIMARLLRWYAPQCAAAVANSMSVAEDVLSLCRDRLRVYTVHNAIDLSRFSPTGPTVDLDSLAGLPPAAPGAVRVGLPGTLARWKGHETFLKALSLLPPSLRVRGYVIGGAVYGTDGSQHAIEDLQRFAVELGVSHNVGFTGFVDDPASVLRALDVVVHASTSPEPFGLVIVEAMACGRAVIVSEAGGATEIVTIGHDALGHPPGDAKILADRIAQLASDAEFRARLGKQGRVTAEGRFNRARLAEALVPIYRRVVSPVGC